MAKESERPLRLDRQRFVQPLDRLVKLPGTVMSRPQDVERSPRLVDSDLLRQFHQPRQIDVRVGGQEAAPDQFFGKIGIQGSVKALAQLPTGPIIAIRIAKV